MDDLSESGRHEEGLESGKGFFDRSPKSRFRNDAPSTSRNRVPLRPTRSGQLHQTREIAGTAACSVLYSRWPASEQMLRKEFQAWESVRDERLCIGKRW